MTTSIRLTTRAHLLLVIAALKFAQEQRAGSAQTRKNIGVALSSARRDLVKLKRKRTRRQQ